MLGPHLPGPSGKVNGSPGVQGAAQRCHSPGGVSGIPTDQGSVVTPGTVASVSPAARLLRMESRGRRRHAPTQARPGAVTRLSVASGCCSEPVPRAVHLTVDTPQGPSGHFQPELDQPLLPLRARVPWRGRPHAYPCSGPCAVTLTHGAPFDDCGLGALGPGLAAPHPLGPQEQPHTGAPKLPAFELRPRLRIAWCHIKGALPAVTPPE